MVRPCRCVQHINTRALQHAQRELLPTGSISLRPVNIPTQMVIRRYWSADDLNSLVANHDASHPAPLVIGHPASDDPRYGQVSEYKLDAAGKLWFKAKDIEPTFEQMVADKRFPERSIAIDPDGQGGFKVRHIGFLGAVPPALQLTPMQYGLSGRPAYEYAGEFAPDATTPRVLGRAMRRLREFIVEYFGVDAADKVMPEYEVESIQEHATDLTSPPKFDSSTYYQPTGDEPMPETHHFTQAELDAAVKAAKAESQAAFAKDNAALKGELDKVRRERLAGAYQSQVDKAVSEGRLSPAQSEGLVEFMLALPDGADAPFTFSRGEDDKAEEVKQTPMQFFEAFIGKLGKQLDLEYELRRCG